MAKESDPYCNQGEHFHSPATPLMYLPKNLLSQDSGPMPKHLLLHLPDLLISSGISYLHLLMILLLAENLQHCQYKLSPAIAVGAVEGAPVVAAVNGKVYSIEQNAQTGTTLTMELGNGYQAVYGQLTDLTVSEGDTIKKGTTIGYIAQPTKYYSTEGTNLYFAMKKNGEPIDPIEYLP